MRSNSSQTILRISILLGLGWSSTACPAAESHCWQWAGWGGGGFYWSCAWHPTKDGVIYMGGDVAGVYKTEDKGLHWRLSNRGLADYEVYSLAVDQQNPDTVYAGTPTGFCKSTDGGEHWEFLKATGKNALAITADRHKSVRALAVDPANGAVLYAGTPKGGLFKSLDGGQMWRKLDYLPAIQEKPKQPAAEPPAFSGKGSLVLSYDSDAADWNKNGRAEKHFDPPADWSGYSKVTARFCVPPRAPKLEGELAIQTGDKWVWQGGAFVAGKAGAWTELSLPLAGLKDLRQVRVFYFIVRSVQTGYQGEIYLDNVVLHGAAGSDVVLADWEKPGDAEGWIVNRKMKDATFMVQARQSAAPASVRERGVIGAVTVSPSNPRVVLAASSLFGVLKSEDAGETWHKLPTPAEACSVTVAPGDEKLLYAAFGTEGVQKSTDGGKTWSAVDLGLKPGCAIRDVVIAPGDPATVYCIGAKGWDGQFYRSTDGGQTWQGNRLLKGDRDANPTNPDDYVANAPLSTPTNLSFNPRNPRELFMSANWRPCFSPDGGQSWQERDRGADITCVTDIRFNGRKAYVTAMDEGLAVSDDGGARWHQLCPRKYAGALSGHEWRVAVWPKEGGEKILATCSPWAEPANRVLISEDGGKSFKASLAGLPDYRPTANCMWGQSYARALAADPQDRNIVYLGMDGDAQPADGRCGGGVFKSADGGYTWKQLASQPASRKAFFALAVDPTEPHRLFWGTCGDRGGLYSSEDGGESWRLACDKETWVFNVHVSPSGTVYCPGANLWKSADHGHTWKKISRFQEPLSIVGLEVDPRDENTIWISRVTWGSQAVGGIYKTSDGGSTWQEITGDLPYCKPTILRLQPATGTLWAGGVGLFKLK
jgi:photosystem II stability/assembly factor-like uncharacterized protein